MEKVSFEFEVKQRWSAS